MKGSLYQRPDGAYKVQVEAGPDTRSGRRKRKVEVVPGGKAAARRRLNELLAEAQAGRHRSADGTLAELVEEWWDAAGPGYAVNTRDCYWSLISKWVLPQLGEKEAAKLTGRDCDAVYKAMRQAGRSPATQLKVHSILCAIAAYGIRKEVFVANFAQRAEVPKVRRRPVQAVERDTVEQLLAALPTYAPMLVVGARTGLRRGELLALKWTDLFLTGPQPKLIVYGSIIPVKGGEKGDPRWDYKAPKSDAARNISLDAATVALLRDAKERATEQAREAGGRLGPYVFSPDVLHRRPHAPNTVTQAVRRTRLALGLETITPHKLRHYNASMLVAAGVPVEEVAYRLGHDDTSVTHKLYAHFRPGADHRSVDAMEGII